MKAKKTFSKMPVGEVLSASEIHWQHPELFSNSIFTKIVQNDPKFLKECCVQQLPVRRFDLGRVAAYLYKTNDFPRLKKRLEESEFFQDHWKEIVQVLVKNA